MLTDFGISRATIYSHEIFNNIEEGSSPKGTINWMAYELLEFIEGEMEDETTATCASLCTKETDMWSFGMVVYVRPSLLPPTPFFISVL